MFYEYIIYTKHQKGEHMKIKPFAGVRPPKELAADVASRPYDVLNSAEAKAEAG